MRALEDKLLRIKKDINDKKIMENKLQGQLEATEERIKELSGCKTVKAASKEYDRRYKLYSEKEEELNIAIKELVEEYNDISN